MDKKRVVAVILHFDDNTTMVADTDCVDGDIIYRAGDVSPADVGYKGEGRYKKHEVFWCDPPIDTPYGAS